MAPTPNSKPTASVGQALLIGHLIVTLPIIFMSLGVPFVAIMSTGGLLTWLGLIIVTLVLFQLWWSFIIPRWARWALRRGTPPDKLQRWAVITGLILTRRKGWIIEKAGFRLDPDNPEAFVVNQSGETAPSPSKLPRVAVILGVTSLIGAAAVFTALFTLLFTHSWRPLRIENDAMFPTIQNGDLIFVSTGPHPIKRGDLVLARNPRAWTYIAIQRVIGLPNEAIRVDERGQVYINNRLFEEAYLPPPGSRLLEPIDERTIKANSYWLMSDNRYSRERGAVSAEDIYGKPVWRYWPLDRVGIIK